MMKLRQDRQTKILTAKHNSNIDFKLGNKVRLYNSYTSIWDIAGETIQEIPSEDGISGSFLIQDEDGIEIWGNAKYINLRAVGSQWKK